jgi:quinol monooxygenase YgiN
MPMSRIMVVVEFELKPEHRSQFIELIKGHAQRSRAEDGCQQFDMLPVTVRPDWAGPVTWRWNICKAKQTSV